MGKIWRTQHSKIQDHKINKVWNVRNHNMYCILLQEHLFMSINHVYLPKALQIREL